MFSSLLHSNSKPFSNVLHYSLTFLRSMGGGPRTFPGGLNKWQWKRMHEKKAKTKENKFLDQEFQLYQARIRSQIRAKVAGKNSNSNLNEKSKESHGPMTGEDHVKKLSDRFMTEGAEDLWNEDDGPLKSVSIAKKSVDNTRNLGDNRGNLVENGMNFGDKRGNLMGNRENLGDNRGLGLKPRYYSVQAGRKASPPRFRLRKNVNSSSEDEDDYEGERDSKLLRFPKLGVREEESEGDSRGGKREKNVGSRAALGKYDMKRTRLSQKAIEEEVEMSEHIDVIREELKKRKLMEQEVEQCREETLLSNKRFDECNISPLTVKALSSAGYIQMTKVQEATLSVCLDGMDALVKAKTGTGKSAAFLLPAIETVVKAISVKSNQRVPPVLVLVICPTRELASQIAAEANVMVRYHDGIGVQTLIGGTRFKDDLRRLESDPCQIIVATPGRLLDHIENKSGFSARLMGLKMLILDEADRLLDLGFRKDIEKIVDCVPRKRQSVLLSATIPKEVRRVSQVVLKKEHAFIDTVGVGGIETHEKVKQSYYVAPHESHFQVVYQLLKDHISKVVDYKVIVFCTTSMVTSLMFLLLQEMKMNVREMHSRKTQLYRTRTTDEFRESKRLILVTSDVSARGMDYPDVTLVIQVGIPTDREQYIHRLGRTGREGKEGEGILLLAPWENYFLDDIKDLPLQKFPSLQLDSDVKLKVKDALVNMDCSVKEAAYHAWLGYYNSIREIGRDKTTLVELANKFCDSIGLNKPPSLFRKTAVKMGLRDIPGIRIRK
ncbi:RNA helicase [Ranunculus cassubicifolius]